MLLLCNYFPFWVNKYLLGIIWCINFLFRYICSLMCLMDRDNIMLKIKLRRTALGYSQDEVAKAISMDRSQYSKVEKLQIDLNLEKLLKLMQFLNLTWSDFENKDDLPSQESIDLLQLKKQMSEMQSMMEKIKDKK
jgi:transcriptional regulator with XRE-family HTH domain